jgi:hypothetical protein
VHDDARPYQIPSDPSSFLATSAVSSFLLLRSFFPVRPVATQMTTTTWRRSLAPCRKKLTGFMKIKKKKRECNPCEPGSPPLDLKKEERWTDKIDSSGTMDPCDVQDDQSEPWWHLSLRKFRPPTQIRDFASRSRLWISNETTS